MTTTRTLALTTLALLGIAAMVWGVSSVSSTYDEGYEVGICTVHLYEARPTYTEQQARTQCEQDDTLRELIVDQPIRPPTSAEA